MEPGIHRGIPFDAYLALPYASASDLKLLRRSPWNYRWAKDHPESRESKSKSNGTAAHLAILEPHRLVTDVAVWEGDRRGKEWKEFEAANSNLLILKRDEYAAVEAQRDALRSHPAAMRYLAKGEAEVTIIWDDPQTGLRCKGRIDWLTTMDGQLTLVDVKTTRDINAYRFGGQAFHLGYHIQFAHYLDGWYALTGENAPFLVLAVENQAPYEPAVFSVPDGVLEVGRDERSDLLTLLRECTDSGQWPPACVEEIYLELPRYAYGSEDNNISDLGLVLDPGA